MNAAGIIWKRPCRQPNSVPGLPISNGYWNRQAAVCKERPQITYKNWVIPPLPWRYQIHHHKLGSMLSEGCYKIEPYVTEY